MAKTTGSGSILLKLVIVLLSIILIAVIIIPGQIWDQEKQEMNIAHGNMSSIYEAEKFYKKIKGSYTTDAAELIRVVRQDSSLQKLQMVVNNTRALTDLLDSYSNIPLIHSLRVINDNLAQIREDLNNNRRNFRMYEDIKNEAENLKVQISAFNNADKFPNYVEATVFLDSLRQLRQDLSDYSLQSGAAKTKIVVDTLQKVFGKINMSGLETEWKPISDRLETFVKSVLRSKLVNVTSVGDRVRDFKKLVDEHFEKINTMDVNRAIAKSDEIAKALDTKYQEFIANYLVTSQHALYRLSDADSMVLHLTEDNFYCPVTGDQIKILFPEDSMHVKVESPVLVPELNSKMSAIAEQVKGLSALPAFTAYIDTLQYLKAKGYAIRKRLRKNTDIFIQYKEMEDIIGKFADISVMTAYSNLLNLSSQIEGNESFSSMKSLAEDGLNGIRIFKQAYSENFFGNLDSLNNDLVSSIQKYDSLLAKVRRLPKDITTFEEDIVTLNGMLNTIKNAKDSNYESIEKALGDAYLFASEGTTKRVYGVFNKKIVNFGYIYKDSKSWEE